MNELHDVIKHSTLPLYANDSKIFRTIDEVEDSTEMSEDMVKLES